MKYEECKDQVLIKVIRTKLNVSTFWTLEKFEQKLSEMKELYQVKLMSVIVLCILCVHRWNILALWHPMMHNYRSQCLYQLPTHLKALIHFIEVCNMYSLPVGAVMW